MRTSEKYRPAVAKEKPWGIPTAHLVVALVIPLVIYFGYSAGQKALEVYRLNEEAAQVRQEIEGLKAENAQLRKQLEYLSSDTYVERVAREELNLIKPGDKSVVVLAAEGRKGSGGASGSDGGKVDDMPNWLKWWNFFFGEER